ncbi:MAG TPA: LLM class F420-dependent oxidoreductase [Acidimicrobiales bacterium]|nr:LLM class F420-dependent oxidoreductase [Acidimicrobiales bacterium]
MKLGLMPSYRTSAVADPAYATALARLAEAEGCESIWVVEHVVVPASYRSRYPYSADGRMGLTGDEAIPDPLDWLAYVAGCTERLRLATGMLILPEHNPVVLAKRLATIDALSGGRLLVGVGVGWLREEFEAVGVPFEARGQRADEYVAAMRALWAPGASSYQGRFVSFSGVKCHPKPAAGRIPVVVGGSSPAAARRAGRLGDGFFPLGMSPEELARALSAMAEEARRFGRDPAEVEVTVHATMDLDLARRYAELGVSRMVASAFDRPGLDDTRAMLGRLIERVISKLGD